MMVTTTICKLTTNQATTLHPELIDSDTTPNHPGTNVNIPKPPFWTINTAKLFTDRLANLWKTFTQDLQIAQKVFEDQMQQLEKLLSLLPQTPCATQSITSQNLAVNPCFVPHQLTSFQPNNQQIEFFRNSSLPIPIEHPLNTHFLLPTGEYNSAATGPLCYKAYLFSFLPFMQKIHQPTAPDTQFDPTACLAWSNWLFNNINILDLAYCTTLLSSRTYAHNLPCWLAYHQISSYHDTTAIVWHHGQHLLPPWPPPHFFSGLPAFRQFDDFRPDVFWPINHNRSGHLLSLNTWPTMHVSQSSNHSYHMQPWPPPQYCTTYLCCVVPLKPMTADKNLLEPP